jgi:two-component system cell cycle response regulator
LLLDLDRFKPLNDLHGHQAGDVVLRYIAQSIRRTVRAIDIVCRIGGDEFAVLMPDTDPDNCRVLSERLRESVTSRSISIGRRGGTIAVTASYGTATFPRHADSAERLLWCADMALLAAKQSGGGTAVYFDPSHHVPSPSVRRASDGME